MNVNRILQTKYLVGPGGIPYTREERVKLAMRSHENQVKNLTTESRQVRRQRERLAKKGWIQVAQQAPAIRNAAEMPK